MNDMNQYILSSDYSYSVPLYDGNMLRADQSWVAVDKNKQTKELQEQIDVLRNQINYALEQIEKLKTPLHYESLL